MTASGSDSGCRSLRVPGGEAVVRWGSDGIVLDCGEGRLLASPALVPLPLTESSAVAPGRPLFRSEPGGDVVLWEQAPASGPVARAWGEIRFTASGLSMQTSYVARTDHVLGGWDILPSGSRSTFDVVENLWNRPAEVSNFIELPLRSPGRTTTGGANRIWAPHVSAICLCGGGRRLVLGVPEVTSAYGLHLEWEGDGRCRSWLDFGGRAGLPVRTGENVVSPVVHWRVFRDATSLEAMADFFAAFTWDPVPPAPLADHWRKPWYCTWADQQSMSDNRRQGHACRTGLLDERFVLRAADRIQEERLPVGTLVIDDGWQTHRGDWDVDVRKFPDFRGLVDSLHDRGLSVVLWWAPFCHDASARMSREDWMFCRGLDVRGERLIDYSSPRVQREHLAPLMRRMFSADADCWNVDGVKIDFLADRHHPGAMPTDSAWHGQERGLLNFYRRVWELSHEHKDDVCLYGTAQHPAFAPWQNLLGLEETNTPESRWIPSRAQMQSSLMPGTAITAHFNFFCKGVESYIGHCASNGVIPQIPPLFEDLAGYHPDSRYFETLRKTMAAHCEIR